MVTILLITGIAIAALSTPAPRYAYVTATIPRFSLPQDLTIDLPMTDSILIRGSQLSLTSIGRLEVKDRRTETEASSENVDRLTISDSESVSSALRFKSHGPRGEFQLHLPAGTLFTSDCTRSGEPLCVRYEPPEKRQIRIDFQAGTFDFESAVRVRIQPQIIKPGSEEPSSYSLRATSATSLVKLEGTISNEIRFLLPGTHVFSSRPKDGRLASFPPDEVQLSDGKLAEVSFRGAEDAQVSLVAISDTHLSPAVRFDWTAVSTSTGEDGPAIHVSGRGIVKSLRQDGRELLPSALSDILTAEPKTRGLWGGITLFLVASGALLLKRATDNLVRLILPE